MRGVQKIENLCWWCRHAVPKTDNKGQYVCGCSWSIDKSPIDGWYATLEYKSGSSTVKGMMTYSVIFCPEYVNDSTPDDLDHILTSTKELFWINYKKYGVDIFPTSVVFDRKSQRKKIKKPGMSDEEYERAKKERQREYHRKWYSENLGKAREIGRRYRNERYRSEHPGSKRYQKSGMPYGTYSGHRKEYMKIYSKAYYARKQAQKKGESNETD